MKSAPSRRRFLAAGMAAGVALPGTTLFAQTPAAKAPERPAGGPSLYDVVQERKRVLLGVRSDAPPVGFIDQSGKNVGFGVDIATRIAAALKVEPELRTVTATSRIPLIQTGAVDLCVETALITRERWKVVDFSLPYYLDYVGNRMVVKKGTPIKGYADIKNKKIAVVQGSAGIPRIKANQPAAELVYLQDYPAAVLAVKRGQADAMYAMDNIVTELLAKDRDGELEATPPLMSEQSYGIIVHQNDSKWRNEINFILIDMWKSGAYTELFQKYFKKEPDPRFSFPSWEA